MSMLKLSCHCGQIRIDIKKQPDFIHECNCTLCSKSGASWAYFHSALTLHSRQTGTGTSTHTRMKSPPPTFLILPAANPTPAPAQPPNPPACPRAGLP